MYVAKSASDKTDDWPLWYVEHNGKNIIPELYHQVHGYEIPAPCFLTKENSIFLANKLNKKETK